MTNETQYNFSKEDFNNIREEERHRGAYEALESLHHKLWSLLAEYEYSDIGEFNEDVDEDENSEWNGDHLLHEGTHHGIRLCIEALGKVINEVDDMYNEHTKHCHYCPTRS